MWSGLKRDDSRAPKLRIFVRYFNLLARREEAVNTGLTCIKTKAATGPSVEATREYGTLNSKRCAGEPAASGRSKSLEGAYALEGVSLRLNASTIMPSAPEINDPASTPTLTSSCNSALSGNARMPMNRLMVKPMPHSRATP